MKIKLLVYLGILILSPSFSSLAQNSDSASIDFSEIILEPFAITGQMIGNVYADINANGVRDAGENGLQGIDVIIFNANNNGQTVQTDANGNWSAIDVPGPALVLIDPTDLPPGFLQTEGTDPTSVIIVDNAIVDAGNDGYTFVGQLSGHLYADVNGSGFQNGGEPDLPNVDVIIEDEFGNTQTVVTNADGDWTAEAVAGDVTVTINVNDPDFPGCAFQTEGTNPSTHNLPIDADIFTENDGFFESTQVSGLVYNDINANGTQDAGEPGVAGVDVLVEFSTGFQTTLISNANGNYNIRVPQGTTTIEIDETDQDFLQGAVQTEGTNPTTFTAICGEDYDEVDGFQEQGILQGHLYLDVNGSAFQNASEPDLPNIDVVVEDFLGNTQTVTTDANGDWSAVLPIGEATSTIDVSDPDFPACAFQSEGTNPTTSTVIANGIVNEIDGFFESAEIFGLVYNDLNGDGTQSIDEPGLPGVDVLITFSTGFQTTLITDANGAYDIRVPQGTTTIEIDENDQDFIIGANQTEGTNPTTFDAICGEEYTEVDGYQEQGILQGHIYLDVNGSAFQNASEPDLPNVDVLVEDAFGNTQVVTTDANGDWSAVLSIGLATSTIDINDPDFPTCAFQTDGTNPTTTTVFANETISEIDGFFESAEIFGLVYNDLNGNGTQNIGEPGLPGVDVLVTFSTGFQTTLITDANGAYDIRVPQGTTTVEIDENDQDFIVGASQTEGTNPTTFNAICGEEYNEVDGFQEQGILEGHIYLDENGSAFQNPSEPDLPNVDVIVVDAFGNTQTITTDANGDWSLVLPVGTATATIDVTDPDFPECAFQTEGTNPTTSNVIANETVSQIDGFFESAQVFGLVYNDLNGNGTQDAGEPGVPGVDILVTFSSGFQTTLITDANGNYNIRVPDGSTQIEIDETDTDFLQNAIQTDGGNPTTFIATCGETYNETDGFQQQGVLEGHLYLDINGSAFQNASEPDLPNVDVLVEDAFGNTQTVTSDANGDWSVTLPVGTAVSTININDPDFPTCAFQSEGTNPTTSSVLANQTVSEIDGFFESTEVSGLIYNDLNGDGTQNNAEPGLPGVDVIVTYSTGFQTTLITDANGNYSIRVPQGVTEILIDETDTDFLLGGVQTEGSNATNFEAICGETYTEIDGYQQQGTIEGHIYADINGSGFQNPNEPDLPNIDVLIEDAFGNTQIVSSNANGDWSALVPTGPTISTIDVSDPDFPSCAFQSEGTNPTTSTVVANETVSEIDGYFESAEINGLVYNDLNGNGVQDATDPGLAGVDVLVTFSTGFQTTVITDANGNYSTRVSQGFTTIEIDETDTDFLTSATQTEGSNPTIFNAVCGEVYSEVDGFQELEDYQGHLYLDVNGSAFQDPSEPDLPNVDISIEDEFGTTQIVSTNANGDWTVTVPVGTIITTIDTTDPDFPSCAFQTQGTNPTTITVVPNENAIEIDGFFESAEIEGLVYEDVNGNGTQDVGEPGLPGVDVSVTFSTGFQTTLITDANGNYAIRVPQGNTIIEVDETDDDFPVGAVLTDGTNATIFNAICGEIYTEVDGYFISNNEVGTLSGLIYEDTNANSVQDNGELGLPDIDVIITDAEGQQFTISTDANGEWSIELIVGPAVSDIDESDPDYPAFAVQTEGTDPTTTNILVNQSILSDNDGFFINDNPALVSGHLYEDTNGNGIQDAGEPDLPNVDVTIQDVFGNLQEVETDATGDYLVETPPGEITITISTSDPDFPNCAFQTEGTNPTVVQLTAGQNYTDFNGFFESAEVFGVVFNDINANGSQDAGELSLENIDVIITLSNGDQITIVTDANGNYEARVPVGTTTIEVDEDDPDFISGAVQTTGSNPTTFNAACGESYIYVDAFQARGSIQGHLYLDIDGNGSQEANEPNLSNVDILIEDVLGNAQLLTTDINGDWSTVLPAGEVTTTIDIFSPNFPTCAFQTEGTNPTTSTIIGDELISETDGFFESGEVSGLLYNDQNANGTQDPGEPALAQVDVFITDALGNQTTLVTDVDGTYNIRVPQGETIIEIDENDPDFIADAVQTEGNNPTLINVDCGSFYEEIDGYTNPNQDDTGFLSGHLYLDVNGNGSQQANESGIPNVQIQITDANGDQFFISTDVNGDWTVEVPIGPTISDIDETDPDFPDLAIQTEGTDPTTTNILLNQDVFSDDDGFFVPNSSITSEVEGHLYEDTNGNGTQNNDEPDLANIDVTLTDDFGTTTTTTTDANGDWQSTVVAGNIISDVDESDPDFPAGFLQTEGTDPTTTFAVPNVLTFTENDGFADPTVVNVGTLTGHLYLDLNANATQDSGEPDLPSINVEITDVNGDVSIVSTNVNGDWSIVLPVGEAISSINQNDPDFPNLAIQTEGSDPTTTEVITGEQTLSDNDGFFVPNGDVLTEVTGHLYEDVNGNGTQDNGEPDLPNIDVVLTDSFDTEQTVSTDASGDWSATVVAGNIISDIDNSDPDFPTGFVQTEGTDPTTTLAPPSSTVFTDNDGYSDPSPSNSGTLTGHLYLDANGNATQDSGEINLADIDVNITASNGVEFLVSTNANGDWSIVLAAGEAVSNIDETDPDFPDLAIQTEGSDPTTTNVLVGQTLLSDNDGYFVPDQNLTAEVEGHLYEDTNGNGTQDANEPNLTDVDLTLTDDFETTQVVSTNANGDWIATVVAGNILSDIDETDPDFPALATQTEGTDPTLSFAPPTMTTFTENDGFSFVQNNQDEVIIYNAVSADGNGQNDFFKIENIQDFPQNTLQIFNRQGNEVFTASGYNNTSVRFEGLSNASNTIQQSKQLPAGVYFYILKYVNNQGQTKQLTGYLYLNN